MAQDVVVIGQLGRESVAEKGKSTFGAKRKSSGFSHDKFGCIGGVR